MKAREYCCSIFAGTLLVLLWYGQHMLVFANPFYRVIAWLVYPVISAATVFALLRHKCSERYLVKFSLFVLSLMVCVFALDTTRLHDHILTILRNNYSRARAAGELVDMLRSLYFIILNAVGVLVSFCFCQIAERGNNHGASDAGVSGNGTFKKLH